MGAGVGPSSDFMHVVNGPVEQLAEAGRWIFFLKLFIILYPEKTPYFV
jgi:hypothetical protein